jgi:mannose-1-phosphate guanylyltransferase/mannose-6-phosphate isomerase
MRALLLAGGAGTRLWPLSTEDRPKQFLRLSGGESLLHQAYERIRPICEEEVFVATAEKYADLTLSEIRTMSSDKLVLEPVRRNTGPALLCAALRFERDGNDVTAAIPADQSVADDEAFRCAILSAARIAAEEDAIVTLGVPPTGPETSFGYLQTEAASGDPPRRRATRFVEKPDRETARTLLGQVGTLWNAGVFVFRPSVLLEEAEAACPELLEGCRRYDARWREGSDSGEREAYAALPAISIDHAVMQGASRILCIPMEAGWSDLGSYRAVAGICGRDAQGNLVLSDRPVVTVGLRDFVVASSADGVLIAPLSEDEEIARALARRN